MFQQYTVPGEAPQSQVEALGEQLRRIWVEVVYTPPSVDNGNLHVFDCTGLRG